MIRRGSSIRVRMTLLVSIVSGDLWWCHREAHAFSPWHVSRTGRSSVGSVSVWSSSNRNRPDNDDFLSWGEEDDEDAKLFGALSSSSSGTASDAPSRDRSGGSTRQFCLGYDVTLVSFAGSMGFDEVVDWEYYDRDNHNRVVNNVGLLDPTQPTRTRTSSGSVVRIFRGELLGRVAASLRAQGRDVRVLVKEFSGDQAVSLAEAELRCVGKLQSEVLCGGGDDETSRPGEDWSTTASSRYLLGQEQGDTRADDVNLMKLMRALSTTTNFVGILGLLNLATFLADDDQDLPNEWYRALGVPPPKPDSVWIVYEYAGLSTLARYCRPPPLLRHAQLLPKRGLFGNPVPPPPLPTWDQRADYIVRGVLRGALRGVATLHEQGVAHRSIGRHSLLLSSTQSDKARAADMYSVNANELVVKLSDFGFAGLVADSPQDDDLRRRARAFGIGSARPGDERARGRRTPPTTAFASSLALTNFAMAEDLHALGFVFVGVLLTTLAEFPVDNNNNNNSDMMKNYQSLLDNMDEDSLQRLLGDIFEKNVREFREYCAAEEIWTKVVNLLDQHDGAGWDLLEKLCFARERAGEAQDSLQLTTARGLLSNRLFTG